MLIPLTGSLLRPRAVGALIPGEATEATLEILRIRREAQAGESWNRGHAAYIAGDMPEAARWLDRARRIAPEDQTVALVLALVRLRQGSNAAASMFEAILRRHDLRTAWLGLAQARRLAGHHEGAAAALGEAFSRHAASVDPGLAELADAIARASGASGWCAVDAGLRLTASAGPGRLRLRLDGRDRACPAGRVLDLPLEWRLSDRLEVFSGDRPLLGSPLAFDRISAIEGCIEADSGGIAGWAWHPGDPDRDPELLVVPARGRALTVTASVLASDLAGQLPLARPRRVVVSAALLAGLTGPFRVTGADGRNLLGSPLDPGAEAGSGAVLARFATRLYPAFRGRATKIEKIPTFAPVSAQITGPAPTAPASVRPVAVVVPVFQGFPRTRACLESVLATIAADVGVVVADDAGPDPALRAYLDDLAQAGRIRLLRNRVNLGFPATANAGMRACPGADIVLLNSDTLVAPGWLARLVAAGRSAPDIGTVTPLSNDATILSYPAVAGGNKVPDLAATRDLAALAHRANGGRVVDIPTAVGFCMFIRRDCLDRVGLFREDLFAQGYGEENDFCLRARHLGWRHVAAPGVFVAHVGGESFGAARRHLVARNLAVLERLHPGYAALIAAFEKRDKLAEARRRVDVLRWRARHGGTPKAAVLLITHDMGGGVQRQVATRIAALTANGFRPIVLRPDLRVDGFCQIDDSSDRGFPNLRFAVPGELRQLARFLAAQNPDHVELHHLVGHRHAVLALCRDMGLPTEIHVHDYAWFCPRISLIGPERRYCGEPAPVHCEACVADAGRNIEEDISVIDLRRRSADDFARARRVVAPSGDAARRIARHFPGTAAEIVPWDRSAPTARRPPPLRDKMRIVVIGAIGTEKGYDVLLACARDAALRGLPLEFVVVGYTIDDARLLATGLVFVTGEYQAAELQDLIAAQGGDLAWLPSIWPETWCFTLSEAWQAGLDVVAFDLGAPAERIRACGHGLLLPLGLPAASLNNTFLARRVALQNAPGVSPDVTGRQDGVALPKPPGNEPSRLPPFQDRLE